MTAGNRHCFQGDTSFIWFDTYSDDVYDVYISTQAMVKAKGNTRFDINV